jgi:Rap1a immunity proteins
VRFDTSIESTRRWAFMNDAQQFMEMGSEGQTKTLLETCLPPDSPLTQFIRVFVSYGEQHPEELNLPAGVLVLHAVKKPFPCPTG